MEGGSSQKLPLSKGQLASFIGGIIEKHVKSLDGKLLKDYQFERMGNIVDDLKYGVENHYQYTVMPTRTGKTFIYGQMLLALSNHKKENPADVEIIKKSLVVLPLKYAIDKIAIQLASPKIGIPAEQIGVYHSGRDLAEKREAVNKDILILTRNSLRALVKKGVISPDTHAFVVPDEIHGNTGPETKKALSPFQEAAVTSGFTATHIFATGENVGQLLFNGKGPVAEMTYIEAVDRDALAPIKNIRLRTGIELGKLNIVAGDYSPKQLEESLIEKGLLRDYSILKFYQNYYDHETGVKFSEQKALIFAAGIEHAKRLENMAQRMFGKENVVAIHSGIEKEKLKERIKRIETEKPQILISVKMAMESIDLPEYSIALMTQPTLSPIKAVQGPGRVTGKDENNERKIAFVVNAVDNDTPDALIFGNVVGGFHLFPEKGRERYIINPQAKDKPFSLADIFPEDSIQHDVGVLNGIYESDRFRDSISTKIKGIIKDKDSLTEYTREVTIYHDHMGFAGFYGEGQSVIQGLKISKTGLPQDWAAGRKDFLSYFAAPNKKLLNEVYDQLMEQILLNKTPVLKDNNIRTILYSDKGKNALAFSPKAIMDIADICGISTEKGWPYIYKDNGPERDYNVNYRFEKYLGFETYNNHLMTHTIYSMEDYIGAKERFPANKKTFASPYWDYIPDEVAETVKGIRPVKLEDKYTALAFSEDDMQLMKRRFIKYEKEHPREYTMDEMPGGWIAGKTNIYNELARDRDLSDKISYHNFAKLYRVIQFSMQKILYISDWDKDGGKHMSDDDVVSDTVIYNDGKKNQLAVSPHFLKLMKNELLAFYKDASHETPLIKDDEVTGLKNALKALNVNISYPQINDLYANLIWQLNKGVPPLINYKKVIASLAENNGKKEVSFSKQALEELNNFLKDADGKFDASFKRANSSGSYILLSEKTGPYKFMGADELDNDNLVHSIDQKILRSKVLARENIILIDSYVIDNIKGYPLLVMGQKDFTALPGFRAADAEGNIMINDASYKLHSHAEIMKMAMQPEKDLLEHGGIRPAIAPVAKIRT